MTQLKQVKEENITQLMGEKPGDIIILDSRNWDHCLGHSNPRDKFVLLFLLWNYFIPHALATYTDGTYHL